MENQSMKTPLNLVQAQILTRNAREGQYLSYSELDKSLDADRDEDNMGVMNLGQATVAHMAVEWLQLICHGASQRAGWWTDPMSGRSTKDNPLTFSNKLMLIVSEVSEAMEADRKDAMDDKLPHRKGAEVELADALIRILDLAGAYGFDLAGALVEKMVYNANRADHKRENRAAEGGKRY